MKHVIGVLLFFMSAAASGGASEADYDKALTAYVGELRHYNVLAAEVDTLKAEAKYVRHGARVFGEGWRDRLAQVEEEASAKLAEYVETAERVKKARAALDSLKAATTQADAD